MSEAYLQSKVVKYLKSMGCYVIKTTPGPGVPVGCPDVIFMKDGFWGGLEVKASKTSKFQPLQKQTIELLDTMSWCKAVYPENWETIKVELSLVLR
jgi:Holliday junction resolvase